MPENLPAPGTFLTPALQQTYKDTIDAFISDTGREVELFFQPSASGCPNCFSSVDGESNGIYNSSNPYGLGAYNIPFPNGSICPVCQNRHNIYTKESKIWHMNVNFEVKDLGFSALGIDPGNVHRTKSVLESFEDIGKCEKALIKGEMCVRVRGPMKTGIGKDMHVRCWWRKQQQ